MNIKEFAKKINGRSRREELIKEEIEKFKDNGIIAIYGYSDDNIEIDGAINDEIGACGGVCFYVDKKMKRIYYPISRYIDEGELSEDFADIVEYYFKENCIEIKGEFGEKGWVIKTDTEHEKAEIKEDGERFGDIIFIKL